MTGDLEIAGMVLAAGESSRMGSDKALLRYRGRTFLETIVSTCHDAGLRPIVVVLGHHADKIRPAAALGEARVVINQEYTRGQTSSLQAGLLALKSEDPAGILLCLVDHPAVTGDTVQKLIETFRRSRAPVVIPTFRNRHGHPLLISVALFEELKRLSPDQGANTVIRNYRHATQFVEVSDAGVLSDVDDPETYRQLK